MPSPQRRNYPPEYHQTTFTGEGGYRIDLYKLTVIFVLLHLGIQINNKS